MVATANELSTRDLPAIRRTAPPGTNNSASGTFSPAGSPLVGRSVPANDIGRDVPVNGDRIRVYRWSPLQTNCPRGTCLRYEGQPRPERTTVPPEHSPPQAAPSWGVRFPRTISGETYPSTVTESGSTDGRHCKRTVHEGPACDTKDSPARNEQQCLRNILPRRQPPRGAFGSRERYRARRTH